jgi:hypothetical protein
VCDEDNLLIVKLSQNFPQGSGPGVLASRHSGKPNSTAIEHIVRVGQSIPVQLDNSIRGSQSNSLLKYGISCISGTDLGIETMDKDKNPALTFCRFGNFCQRLNAEIV